MRSCLVGLLALLLVTCSGGHPLVTRPAERAVPESVCALVADPKRFEGRSVTFEVFVESDGLHHTLLMDRPMPWTRGEHAEPSVRDLEWCDRGISFRMGGELKETTEILDAIYRPWPGTHNKTIQGIFTGVLKQDPRDDGLFPYILEVSAVKSLKIHIGDQPW